MKIYCQNCGHLNEDNQKYCNKCGQEIKESTNGIDDPEVSEVNEPFEEDLLMKFVDKNQSYYSNKWNKMAKKGKDVSFNLAAFFFTLFWLGYRKMYMNVLYISLLFLGLDIVLYLIGYKYDYFNDPIDNSVGIGVAVSIGLMGNKMYKNHAEREIKKIQETDNQSEQSWKKRGGRSILSAFLAFLIFLGVYVIPSAFIIPEKIDEVETVKYTEFIEHPDISIAALFNDLFTDGEWLHIESKDEYDVVEYNGKKEIEDVTHEASIILIVIQMKKR